MLNRGSIKNPRILFGVLAFLLIVVTLSAQSEKRGRLFERLFGKKEEAAMNIQTVENLNLGRNDVVLPFEGRTRKAIILVPQTPAPESGWPLVLMLHGAGGSAEQLYKTSDWVALAEREGIVLVLPDGTPRDETARASFLRNPQTWNNGTLNNLQLSDRSAIGKNINDVGFLMFLLDEISAKIPINPTRVYSSGHSNGSGMSYRLVGENPDRFAAIGVVAGHIRSVLPARENPVPLMQITGDQDPFVPLDGGMAGFGDNKAIVGPAIDAPKQWALLNGFAEEPTVVEDTTDYRTVRWGEIGSRGEVIFTIVKNHGHEWPGEESPLPRKIMGPSSNTMNATEVLWQFFEAHPKNTP